MTCTERFWRKRFSTWLAQPPRSNRVWPRSSTPFAKRAGSQYSETVITGIFRGVRQRRPAPRLRQPSLPARDLVRRDRRAIQERMLRIGCVKYLNALPLIRGWPGEVDFDHPSALCQRVAFGELDVALVSSFEFLRNPLYRIVDDVSISSDGPVYSVVLAHCGELSDIQEIELDPASQTSINLLRCLLAERRLTPRLIRNIGFQPVRPAGLQPADSSENISAGRTG